MNLPYAYLNGMPHIYVGGVWTPYAYINGMPHICVGGVWTPLPHVPLHSSSNPAPVGEGFVPCDGRTFIPHDQKAFASCEDGKTVIYNGVECRVNNPNNPNKHWII